MLSQASLDASIGSLLTTIERTYALVMDNKASLKINATKDVLVEIAQVVQECPQFITKYSETKTFCTPPIPVAFIRLIFFVGSWLGKNVLSQRQRDTTGRRPLKRDVKKSAVEFRGSAYSALLR